MDRFKLLDLVDRMFEKLQTKVGNIIQEAVTKTISKKKKCKKAKWLSVEASRVIKKRREMEGMEKGKNIPLNAEFQRITRKGKKGFLSEQCKEIDESNVMGQTRDLFKKIRDIKGIFHARMGKIKDRKCKAITEAEKIKRW